MQRRPPPCWGGRLTGRLGLGDMNLGRCRPTAPAPPTRLRFVSWNGFNANRSSRAALNGVVSETAPRLSRRRDPRLRSDPNPSPSEPPLSVNGECTIVHSFQAEAARQGTARVAALRPGSGTNKGTDALRSQKKVKASLNKFCLHCRVMSTARGGRAGHLSKAATAASPRT